MEDREKKRNKSLRGRERETEHKKEEGEKKEGSETLASTKVKSCLYTSCLLVLPFKNHPKPFFILCPRKSRTTKTCFFKTSLVKESAK